MINGAAVKRIEEHRTEQHRGRLTVYQADHVEPLRECVRASMQYYLRNLAGHEVTDLHEMVLGEVERPLLETVLDHTRGNQTQAARLLGISRSTLRKKMTQYGVRQED